MVRHALPMRRPLRDLAGDRGGASAVVIGISMTAMMGFAGLAIDVGHWYADKRAAQGAADSAAYSAGVDLLGGDTVSGAQSNAKAVTAQYGLTDGTGGVTVTVNSPPTAGPNSGVTGAVEVIVKKTEGLFFSSFFLSSASVAARAVAVAGTSGQGCLEALKGGSTAGTMTASNGAVINATNCAVQVNSTNSNALTVTGATMNVKTLSVVGNYTTPQGGAVNVSGVKTVGAPAVADPYASVATPSPSTCTTQTLPASASGSNPGSKTNPAVLNPGTFCSGLSIANGLYVNLSPGIYIVESSTGFSLQGGVTVNATGGVTIVLTGSGSTYATANIANGAVFNLTAPTTGATAGLAIMQDRSAPATGVDTIAGGATMNITGALYFPSQTVDYSNGATNTGSTCSQLIANEIAFTGGANLAYTSSCGGTTGIGATATQLTE